MILIFLRIFVNDRQKSIVGQATNNGIFKFYETGIDDFNFLTHFRE